MSKSDLVIALIIMMMIFGPLALRETAANLDSVRSRESLEAVIDSLEAVAVEPEEEALRGLF